MVLNPDILRRASDKENPDRANGRGFGLDSRSEGSKLFQPERNFPHSRFVVQLVTGAGWRLVQKWFSGSGFAGGIPADTCSTFAEVATAVSVTAVRFVVSCVGVLNVVERTLGINEAWKVVWIIEIVSAGTVNNFVKG